MPDKIIIVCEDGVKVTSEVPDWKAFQQNCTHCKRCVSFPPIALMGDNFIVPWEKILVIGKVINPPQKPGADITEAGFDAKEKH